MINHHIRGSLTAALILSISGWTSVSQAEQIQSKPAKFPLSESQVSRSQASPSQASSTSSPGTPWPEPSLHSPSPSTGVPLENGVETAAATSDPTQAEATRKVGDYSSSDSKRSRELAKVAAHTLNNKPAVTLYVRNIPVLTFVGESIGTSSSIKTDSSTSIPSVNPSLSNPSPELPSPEFPRSSPQSPGPVRVSEGVKVSSSSMVGVASQPSPVFNTQDDPLVRASALASRLNELARTEVDASQLEVRWDAKRSLFVIHLQQDPLAYVDGKTAFLPDTTRNGTQDALQVTNRLRRLLGAAPPLKAVADLPKTSPAEAIAASVAYRASGWASWYGPGFHGALSASGEVFNQYAMTAAHRSLPFGTRVRVTNVNTGASVVVRINDRGPFTGGRVIDLSAAAASSIGMMSSGVAPVSLEILGR